jgi:hypothetical protein
MATISIYTLAIEQQSNTPEQLFMAISEVTEGIFDKLIDHSKYNDSEKKSILLYIIFAYSKDSSYLIYGRGSETQKLKIAEVVQLPDYAVKDVCGLKDDTICDTVMSYLEYQAERDFQHYMMKRKLYDDMLGMTTRTMTKEDGKVDFKAIVDAAKYMDDLLENIKAFEKQQRQEWKFKDDNEAEIKSVQDSFKKPVSSLSIENNPELAKK